MNLKDYYAKVRELEDSLAQGDVLLVSKRTPDGGKPGVMTLAPRRLAAQLVVEDKARVASEEERLAWELEEAGRREEARRDEIAQRIQVQVVAEPDSKRKPQHG